MISNPHTITIEALAAQLNVNINEGLSETEAQKRLVEFGENRLERSKQRKAVWILFEQFLDPIIYVLGGAMILAFAFDQSLEGFAILAVLLITAFIGFTMELQAIRSVEALQKMTQTKATVMRDGQITSLRAKLLVPGDIILLNAGDIVPADARLIWHQGLAVKESVLTGESNQVDKEVKELPRKTPITSQVNMLFKGTVALHGNARAIVTATGDSTEIGKISSLTIGAHKERSPLDKKLGKLSRWLIGLTLLLALLITVSGYLQGKDLALMVKIGIALAVAAIPEGLPIVATIALARGMIRLSKKKVIIKRLDAVQTLGETTIVCTDKTGTLTENRMSVHTFLFQDSVINRSDFQLISFFEKAQVGLAFTKMMLVAVLCNNIRSEEKSLNGDSVEIALLNFARDVGIDVVGMRSQYPELEEIPFDAQRKLMLTLNSYENRFLICVKGALENIVNRCETIITKDGIKPFTNKQTWIENTNNVASQGLRVIAFAYKECDSYPTSDKMLEELTLIGIIGFLDPPRSDVKQAIQIYKNAGIKVVMITGDHPSTARKIGEEIGLLSPSDPEDKVVHGKMVKSFDTLEPFEENRFLNATIFARMVPKQKLDLVNFYQRHNAVVGMIGDGVNDAPALKTADIGIAMGIRGTEAAKEVADVILMDDKFTSTELAIRQGRNIFANIRHFVVYLLSCNLAEIISVTIATLSNLPFPLLPLQILFLNLVTDVFPALALGLGRGEPGVMKQLPRNAGEPIVTPKLWRSVILYGLCITTSVIGITAYAHFAMELSSEVVNNMAFYTLILAQLLNVFNLPNKRVSFFKNEVTRNRWVWGALILSLTIVVCAYFIPITKKVLSLVPLTGQQLVVVVLFGTGALVLTQMVKQLGRSRVIDKQN